MYEGAAAWLPASQRMLVLDAQGGLWLSPPMTLADMTKRAASILAAVRGEASFDF